MDTFSLVDNSGGPRLPPAARVDADKDWIENYQAELDTYFQTLKTLNMMNPSETFMVLSSLSARAGEIRSQLMRVDSIRSTSFRTRQIDPFLDQVDRQFKIHSRLQSCRQQEWEMDRGFT